MPKFFVNPSKITATEILLDDENVNHIKNVLRLEVEDEILINDRQGNDYTCIIKAIDSQQILTTIKDQQPSLTEPHTEVVLFQPLIKGEKMEWVIQKAVELGVAKILTVSTERCVVKIDAPKKAQSKVERWNKIAEAAAKQSGRGVVPEVLAPVSFKEAVAYAGAHQLHTLIPYEKEQERSLRTLLQTSNHKAFGIFIGPEGGFTEEEVHYALAKGIHAVTLGKRILRSETASIATLTAIMYQMGEMD